MGAQIGRVLGSACTPTVSSSCHMWEVDVVNLVVCVQYEWFESERFRGRLLDIVRSWADTVAYKQLVREREVD